MAHITPKTLPHRERVIPPNLLMDPPGTAEFQVCLPPRLVGGHAALDIFRNLFGQVQLDLLFQLNIASLATEEPARAHGLPSPCADLSPITKAIARAIWRQRLDSSVSCLRPLAVSL